MPSAAEYDRRVCLFINILNVLHYIVIICIYWDRTFRALGTILFFVPIIIGILTNFIFAAVVLRHSIEWWCFDNRIGYIYLVRVTAHTLRRRKDRENNQFKCHQYDRCGDRCVVSSRVIYREHSVYVCVYECVCVHTYRMLPWTDNLKKMNKI